MDYTLHDYQERFLARATEFVLGARGTNARRVYSFPTGTGKSIMLLALQTVLEKENGLGAWIVTPKLDIVKGMLEKLGVKAGSWTEEKTFKEGWARRITTPIRLRNRQLAGNDVRIDGLLIDECHHHNADTYQELDLLNDVWAVGVTATAFRGTPKGTAAFRAAWGEPEYGLTMADAVARGVLGFPTTEVLPLVDDDLIEVSNGEFVASSVSDTTGSRLADLVQHCRRYVRSLTWDRPTMFAAPTTETAGQLHALLRAAGLPAGLVTQATTSREREAAFKACVSRKEALVQIKVVSEGVDLPIRRLIDIAPMLSPVQWLQMLGRITRPSPTPPHYLCCNRNLLRHAYLLDGLLPLAEAVAAEKAFPIPSKRAGARAIGLEAVGKLKAGEVPLLSGLTGHIYAVSSVEGGRVTEYACLVHPLHPQTVWAKRERPKQEYGAPKIKYPPWVGCAAPEGLEGFASVPAGNPTPPMKAWWARSAARHGLDPTAKVTRKNFTALPVLSDLRRSI